jgi:hypothetical protein
MSDVQDKIDALRRQRLTIDLLATILHNQHWTDSTLAKRERDAQVDLLIKAASESEHLGEEIADLVRRRDRPTAR